MDGFIGVRTQVSENSYFGWVHIQVDAQNASIPFQATFFEYAMNTVPNAGITTGAIPEPASAVGLLALGAAGLAAWRARRREREKAAPAA